MENAIIKVNYTHDAMIDLLIANPSITQNRLAAHFGYTPAWVSRILASDAFQERLAQRKDEIVDPQIRATVEERMRSLVIQSLEVLMQKLEAPAEMVPFGAAAKALEVSSRALGYGVARAPEVNVAQFVVHVPPKAASSREWEAEFSRQD